MAFTSIKKTIERKQTDIRRTGSLEETLHTVLTQTVGDIPKNAYTMTYDTATAVISIFCASKARASTLLLQSGALKAEITLAGIRCKAIVIR